MEEKIIEITEVDPLEIFGVNEKKLKLIKSKFPKLKIISRGNKLKAIGELRELVDFESKIMLLIQHINKFNELSENHIERLLSDGDTEIKKQLNEKDEILVFGNGGKIIRARTVNQRKLVKSFEKNDMVFALGPAGTGKTYTAVALAARALKNKEVKRIILTRPAVEAGENLGFLPGDLKEKLDPYLQPLYDALYDMFPSEKLNEYVEAGIIQIAPLAFMRGRTLDNAFVILDEAQNSTNSQMKMFLTRMGKHAQFCITGDASQIDLPSKQPSGLLIAYSLLKSTKGIGFVEFNGNDVIRHELVKRIIDAYEKEDNKK